MKKVIVFLLVLFVCCAVMTACGNEDLVSDGDAAPTEYVSNVNGYIVQPDNALQQLIEGMPLCYLDYVVENPAYYDVMDRAVIPVIVQNPADFRAFFDGEEDVNKLAAPVQEEMFKTDAGKAIYVDEKFYDTWNLLILSVRESNSQTKHSIDSVTYNNDSCILHVNATREVAEGDGEHTVRHYVFRLPANVYMGVNNSFLKAE